MTAGSETTESPLDRGAIHDSGLSKRAWYFVDVSAGRRDDGLFTFGLDRPARLREARDNRTGDFGNCRIRTESRRDSAT